MKIYIGADHAGFELKQFLLSDSNYEWIDKGTYSLDSVDYPDFAKLVASYIDSNPNEKGVLICGSANGVAMTANKFTNVRAAIAWTPEIASLARQHNDANILCLPARFISSDMAHDILTTFLTTEFEGGRHQRRVEKISL